MGDFFKKAFADMKESAKAQHEVDKANFAAVKAESKAQWEEAKAMGKPETRKAVLKAERDKQIQEATQRKAQTDARITWGRNASLYDGVDDHSLKLHRRKRRSLPCRRSALCIGSWGTQYADLKKYKSGLKGPFQEKRADPAGSALF